MRKFTVLSSEDDCSPNITKMENVILSVLKQIECHSMGITDISQLSDENASAYRQKLAFEIFEEFSLSTDKEIIVQPGDEVCEVEKPAHIDFMEVRKKKQHEKQKKAESVVKSRTKSGVVKPSVLPNAHNKAYNPFQDFDKEKKKQMDVFLKTCKYRLSNLLETPVKTTSFWYRTLRAPQIFLHDMHMDAGINLFRYRYHNHPEWFRSPRLCFLGTNFSSTWCNGFNSFKENGMLPGGAHDYYTGVLPEFCKSNKIWGIDVDDIYTVLHINGNHWLGVWVSIQEKKIVIWDSIYKNTPEAMIAKAVEPLCVMIPHMLNLMATPEEKHLYPNVPYIYERVSPSKIPQNVKQGDCGVYTLKYIECHALGVVCGNDLRDTRIKQIRDKFAVEIYDELKIIGTEDNIIPQLDLYDPPLLTSDAPDE